MSDTSPPNAQAAAAAPTPAASGWRPPLRRRTAIVGGTIALAGVLAVLYAWRLPPFVSTVQTTENAYVRGQVTVLAPQVSGYVVQVGVQDFQTVKAGQLLARIDDRIYRQRLEQARANLMSAEANLANQVQSRRSRQASVGGQEAQLASAQAQLARAQADMRRVEDLASDGSVSLRERDQTRAALLQAQAAVNQVRAAREIARQDVISTEVGRGGLEAAVEGARAAVHLAEIDLANTRIVAPRDGQLGEVSVRQGQYVTAGTQLMAVVPSVMWVTANFKEKQTENIVPGQPAEIAVDALGGDRLRGHVERISPASGSEFSVLRPDNATGNFVKVAQRIPVRIGLEPNQPEARRLRAGMSVVVRVDTAGRRP